MSAPRNQFIDPAGVLATYSWHINHDTEQDGGRERPVDATAPTSGVGHVFQQGDETPLDLNYSGTILDPAQLDAMLDYFEACRTRTIHFLDCMGDRSEVVITSFKPIRVRCARNPRTGGTHYWTYTITMQVIGVLAGTWAGVSP